MDLTGCCVLGRAEVHRNATARACSLSTTPSVVLKVGRTARGGAAVVGV